MTPNELTRLCAESADAIHFGSARAALVAAAQRAREMRELAPFQRDQFADRAERAVERLERRRADPGQLLAALRLHPDAAGADHAALADWFENVAYRSDAARRGEPLAEDLIREFREWCSRDPHFNADNRLQEIERKQSLVRIVAFAPTSPEPEVTLASAAGLESVLRALPIEDARIAPQLEQLAVARHTAARRLQQPLPERLDDCLRACETELDRVGNARLPADPSFLLGHNLSAIRRKVADAAVADDRRADWFDRLDRLDERFNAVRYCGSGYVYQTKYLPHLKNLRGAAERALNFAEVDRELGELRRWSKGGEWGVNRLSRRHRGEVAAEIDDVLSLLQARYRSPEALSRELRLLAETLADLEARSVVGQPDLVSLRERLRLCEAWAGSFAPGTASSHPFADLRTRSERLWESLPRRQEAFVLQLEGQIDAFVARLAGPLDFPAAHCELGELEQTIFDRDNWLPRSKHRRLADRYHDARRAFVARLGDADEIRATFARLDGELEGAARRLRHFLNADALEAEVERIAFRLEHGRFQDSARRALAGLVGRTRARVRGLRRKREEYLAECAANQAAVFRELDEFIRVCHDRAQSSSGDPATWDLLVDADAQLRAARLLEPAQFQVLRDRLDAAFACVKAERARFARVASVVHGEYLDVIANVLQPLEQSCPAPTRADGFRAIEEVKPLRAKLADERRLLARQRHDLYDRLRVVSDAISEVLDRASAAMKQNRVHLRRRLAELEAAVESVQTAGQFPAVIGAHKQLYADLRGTALSIEDRAECRHALEGLWSLIAEKKQALGSTRFDPQRIDHTLTRLEQQGFFLWMDGIPALA